MLNDDILSVIMDNDYLSFLKNYDGLDKYILFALWLTDYSLQELADNLSIARQTIYNAIERNQALYDTYIKPKREG